MQMKHDLKAFSRDIVALIKTSGDTGGSGDKSEKSLQRKDYLVPTRETIVSPLKHEWGQPRSMSGDKKTKQLASAIESVPSVPTATTNFGAGRAAWIFEDTPAGWHADRRHSAVLGRNTHLHAARNKRRCASLRRPLCDQIG